MFIEILDKKRLELFKNLSFLNKYDFYLAGGTALALQIGHRTSVDFDFYTDKSFKSEKLIQDYENQFGKVKKIMEEKDTLYLEVEKVLFSHFVYPYKLLNDIVSIEVVKMVSLEDIAAMKLIAIMQRGKKRDFIDMYYLIDKFGLNKILKFAEKKYAYFEPMLALKSLIYFEDADNDPEDERIRLLNPLFWKEVKSFMVREVAQKKT